MRAGDRGADRILSGYLRGEGKVLLVLYLEGIGVKARDHQAAFQAVVGSLKRE